jgi:formylglycine-generating enzyme required for sulfatase activity
MTEAEIESRARELAAKMTAPSVTPPSPPATPKLPAGAKGFTNSLGMKFVPLPGTQVMMCVHETRNLDFTVFWEDCKRDYDHVEWIEKFVEIDGSFDAKLQHPVVSLTYEVVDDFCKWLSKKERRLYRLPNDKEWSLAVGRVEFPWGNHFPPSAKDDNVSNAVVDDSFNRTAPVMSFEPNQLGIYDMGGNVAELCSSYYNKDLNDHETINAFNELTDDEGGVTLRVIRGASWRGNERLKMRSVHRGYAHPLHIGDNIGFRCVLEMAGR